MENEKLFFKKHIIYLNNLKDLCSTGKVLAYKKIVEHDIDSESVNNNNYSFNTFDFNLLPQEVEQSLFEYFFTIDNIDIDLDGSGCGQCKIKYPTIHLKGNIWLNSEEPTRYWGSLDTYTSFSCKCPRRIDITSTEPGLMFELFPDGEKGWKYLYVFFNIFYTTPITIKEHIALN
jgi:hypothetical protein